MLRTSLWVMAKKRHHTVSEFLLGRFAHDDGKVCQLDIGTGANKRISPNDATVVKHFYSIDIDDGKRSPEVEDALGKIESAAAPRIEALATGNLLPEGRERLELAYFLAMTWLRTPRWREQARSVLEQGMEYWFAERTKVSTVGELREAMGEMAESMSDAEVIGLRDEFLADMNAGIAGIEMPTNGMIGMFLQSMAAMGWVLFCLDWGLVRTDARLILADTARVGLRPDADVSGQRGRAPRVAERRVLRAARSALRARALSKPRDTRPGARLRRGSAQAG